MSQSSPSASPHSAPPPAGAAPSSAGSPGASGETLAADRTVVEIPIERLAPDPFQPRTTFPEETIRDLARSIEQHGLLQALLVRPMQGPNSRGRYWIVAGERRYRAAHLLGLKILPCRIQEYENMAAAVVAIAENVHREDLSEIDKAAALLRLKTLTDRTWDDVAELVKLSRDYVKRLAGLMKLEESVKEKVHSGQISVRTAIALRPLSRQRQVEMAERILREGLTAEEVRAEIRRQNARYTGRAGDEAAFEREEPQKRAPGRVVGGLEEAVAAVEEMDGWLGEQNWAPSRVTESQRAGLERLYEAVSLMQQHLLSIRRPLREAKEPEAERLRRADLPF